MAETGFVVDNEKLKKYKGIDETVVIPDGIHTIGEYAFSGNKHLCKVVIPDSVVFIGNRAFSNCSSLQEISFGKKLKATGTHVFAGCTALKHVDLPGSLKSINYCLFKGCTSLKTVDIGNGTLRISESAFSKCRSMESIVFPSSIQEIKQFAFGKCTGLKTVVFLTDKECRISKNTFIKTGHEISFDRPNKKNHREEFENGFLVKDDVLEGYYGNRAFITLPSTVTSVGSRAFSDNRIVKSIEAPESVKTIGEFGFAFMEELHSISLPGVITLGKACFWASTKLKRIELPSCLERIGANCFGNTHSLSEIDLCHTKADFEGRIAPMSKGLKRFMFPAGIKKIPANAFYFCSKLENVEIPETVNEIGNNAFVGCKSLVSITIPGGVKELNLDAFDSCDALREIILLEHVTKTVGKTNQFCTALPHYADEPRVKQAIIFMGLQGSDKTWYFNRIFAGKFEHINLDTLHTRSKERRMLANCIEEELDFVVDNTNPTKADRQRYIEVAREAGYKVSGYFFESKLRDCIVRNNMRDGKARIPENAIAATSNKMEMPSRSEGFDDLYFVKWNGTGVVMSRKEWEE